MPQFAPPALTKQDLNIEHLDSVCVAAFEAIEIAGVDAIGGVNAIVAGEAVDSFKLAGRICPVIDTG